MWADGASYEYYIGRWSRLVARKFIEWLDIPSDAKWLDVGCGTGILSRTILDVASPQTVVGIDSSEGYIDYSSKQIPEPHVSFRLGDAQALPVESASYDAAVSGLVLNFVAKPNQMLNEMIRAVRIGSTVAVYVWDYAELMQPIRYFWNAAVALDRTILALDEGQLFPLCKPESLIQLFQTSPQLENVEILAIDVPTIFRNFDDYWSPFLGGQGPAPSYTMSLYEKQRDALREYLRRSLPISKDGSIHLIARAWAVRGLRKS
ncbi:MAG TPA: methyltransferase domain-containing protein [Nitrososphaeraceae archaeon]|nr:methyltransferase domain-containing protein [Nitrososphaeraceae archaeon]